MVSRPDWAVGEPCAKCKWGPLSFPYSLVPTPTIPFTASPVKYLLINENDSCQVKVERGGGCAMALLAVWLMRSCVTCRRTTESTTGRGSSRGAWAAGGTVDPATQLPHETCHADTNQRPAWLCHHTTWRSHRLLGQFTGSLTFVIRDALSLN